MQLHETIDCDDGNTITMEMAKLHAEQVADDLITKLHKAVLETVPGSFQRTWLTTPSPQPGEVPTDDAFYATLRASIHVSLVMGIADAMRITLNKIHTKLTTK